MWEGQGKEKRTIHAPFYQSKSILHRVVKDRNKSHTLTCCVPQTEPLRSTSSTRSIFTGCGKWTCDRDVWVNELSISACAWSRAHMTVILIVVQLYLVEMVHRLSTLLTRLSQLKRHIEITRRPALPWIADDHCWKAKRRRSTRISSSKSGVEQGRLCMRAFSIVWGLPSACLVTQPLACGQCSLLIMSNFVLTSEEQVASLRPSKFARRGIATTLSRLSGPIPYSLEKHCYQNRFILLAFGDRV